MMLTLTEAKKLMVGEILYHTVNKNADGTPQRWKINGKVKIWKRNKGRVKVPIKNGLRNCDYITEDTLHLLRQKRNPDA